MDQSNDYVVMKIIFAGDTKSGKSSIISQFFENKFDENIEPTIGIEFNLKISSVDGKLARVYFWDSPGREILKFVAKITYRLAVGAVFVYDITKRSTFEKLKTIHSDVVSAVEENSKYLLLANKIDLDKDREVSREEGEKYADEIGALFYEVSAKVDENISQSLDAFLGALVFSRSSCLEQKED